MLHAETQACIYRVVSVSTKAVPLGTEQLAVLFAGLKQPSKGGQCTEVMT